MKDPNYYSNEHAIKTHGKGDAGHKSKALEKAYNEHMKKQPELNKKAGKERVRLEREANPDLPSAKKSIRRKGFSQGKAFSLALEQTRRYK